MIELTGFGDILRGIFLVYWLIAFALLVAAFIRPKSRIGKIVAVLVVLLVFFSLPGGVAIKNAWEAHARKTQHEKAMAHFAERCKEAGEFIHRTVDGVDGLFVGEIPAYRYDYANPNAADIYNSDLEGDEYIRSFLVGRDAQGKGVVYGEVSKLKPEKDAQGRLVPSVIARPGYAWIEGIDPEDGKRYRFVAEFEHPPGAPDYLDLKIRRLPPVANLPRYSIKRTDISTPEDRALWVAGGSLRVIDMVTNEVLAERIGFMVDPGQGSTAAARSPWIAAQAHSCPSMPVVWDFQGGGGTRIFHTRTFVEKVLKTEGGRS